MNVTYYNRHKSMDSETRSMILSIIREIKYETYNKSDGKETYFFDLENYLYGSFDGYDYSKIAINSNEFTELKSVNNELSCKLINIFAIIEKYPRTEKPNN